MKEKESEELQKLSLFYGMTEEEIQYVIDKINEFK